MAGNRLFVGVGLASIALAACASPNSAQPAQTFITLPERKVTTTTTVETTSTTVAPTTTTAPSAVTTPGATTTTTPAATTTTTINPNFDTTKAVKLLDDPTTWFTKSFPGFPLNPEVTLPTPQLRFTTDAQQTAINDGFIVGFKRASAPPSPPPGTFAQVTLYFDEFASAAQVADAVINIFLQTSSLGLLTTIKIQSQGQTVYIWKPNDHPGLFLFFTSVEFGPDLLSIYGQASNLTDAQFHEVAALMIDADNAALAQAT